jgi:uncharacterized protein (TIGR03437 family)
VVVIYATGLGPYENGYPYGFSLPQAPEFRLVDPVEVVAGDVPVKAAWSGGAAGMAGVQLLKMPITELFPPAATVELRVRVNGHESNKVLLPVE